MYVFTVLSYLILCAGGTKNGGGRLPKPGHIISLAKHEIEIMKLLLRPEY
jgi:hypothetical protein